MIRKEDEKSRNAFEYLSQSIQRNTNVFICSSPYTRISKDTISLAITQLGVILGQYNLVFRVCQLN